VGSPRQATKSENASQSSQDGRAQTRGAEGPIGARVDAESATV